VVAGVASLEGFLRRKRILSVMSARTLRIIAIALAVFFLGQQAPLLALAQDSGDEACCCKDKAASCCRRSHHGAGPGLSSREYCSGCVIWVRHSQPVAAIAVRASVVARFVPAAAPVAPGTRLASVQRDAVLFERPPPSFDL